jgi:hypothetical protein
VTGDVVESVRSVHLTQLGGKLPRMLRAIASAFKTVETNRGLATSIGVFANSVQKGEVSDEAKMGVPSWLPWLSGDHPMQTGRRDLHLAGEIQATAGDPAWHGRLEICVVRTYGERGCFVGCSLAQGNTRSGESHGGQRASTIVVAKPARGRYDRARATEDR